MKKTNVGIAELAICKGAEEELGISGLGSCLAVALYHKKSMAGGLAHIMLPEGPLNNGHKPGKFANTAVRTLYDELRKATGECDGFVAKITGGSQMFRMSQHIAIGEKNIAAVKKELKKLNIRIVGEDCGKNHGRTVSFTALDGLLTVKSVQGTVIL